MTVSNTYIAGFFDGEGCITHRRPSRGSKKYVRVSMSQKTPGVLEEIREHLGYGRLTQRKYPGSGGVWVLTFDGPRYAIPFLELVLPNLIVKRERALETLRDHV